MKVFVTGATGFVGGAVCLALQREGHSVVAFVRNVERARGQLGADVELLATECDDDELARALSTCGGVINLAGAPVAQRWTDAAKRAIVDSRVGLTRRIVDAMRSARASGNSSASGPVVLVSASAVGIWGDAGDRELDADSAPADGFLAQLCVDWEAAATEARNFGVRVACVRIGLVMGAEGGALASMLPAFEHGVGGRLGTGRQYMPWIHLDDLVRLFLEALAKPDYDGVYEGVGPAPVTNAEFTRTLAKVLGKPAFLPVPRAALWLLFGGAGRVITAGQRVFPRRTQAAGFRFEHPELEAALRDVLDASSVRIARGAGGAPKSDYIERRRPRYRLEQELLIDAPLEQVFAFFQQPENLGPLTPPNLDFVIETPGPVEMKQGARIEYRIALGPIPMRWVTHIDLYEPGHAFVDVQEAGPYKAWYHRHEFEAVGDKTRMRDTVYYGVPLEPLGRIGHALFVGPQLRKIFGFRAKAVARRFGPRSSAAAVNAARDDAA